MYYQISLQKACTNLLPLEHILTELPGLDVIYLFLIC